MPQRQYRSQAAGLLYDRQDGLCAFCKEPLLDEQPDEIHHLDGNPGNNAPANLELRHKGQCHAYPGRPPGKGAALYMYVRESDSEPEDPHSARRREANGYMDPSAPAQMRAGAEGKPVFRAWLLGYLAEHGTLSAKEAVAAGAELTGMDITTIGRWLIPMVSIAGKVEQFKEDGEAMLRLNTTRAGG